MRFVITAAVALIAVCTCRPGLAAQIPGDCALLPDRDERLDCFDRFYPPQRESAKEQANEGPIETRRMLESESGRNWFALTPHRPNYVLPATYNFNADFSPYPDLGPFFNDVEIKFQLSLKTKVLGDLWKDSSLWVAYTQQSYWQLFADSEASAPFRETNHEPELRWQIPASFRLFGLNARLAALSLNHQSNGQSDPLSRSWNRIAAELVFERDNFVFAAKTWVRVDDPDDDDNPNIEDFMGRIELGAAYQGDHHTLAIGLRNSLDSDFRSGVQVDWTFPMTQHMKGYVQLYSGYGENLIDMENYNNRIGVGIALTDWL